MKVATKFYLLAAAAVGLVLLDAVLHHAASHVQLRADERALGRLTAEITAIRTAITRGEAFVRRLQDEIPAASKSWRDRFADTESNIAGLRESLRLAAALDATHADPRTALIASAEAALSAIEQDWRASYRLAELEPASATQSVAKQLVPRLEAEFLPTLRKLLRELELAEMRIEEHASSRDAAEDRWHLIDTGLLLIVISGLLFAIHRWMLRPLKRIEADARLINLGERTNVGLTYARSDELGAVARAVNDTVDKLRSTAFSRDELERQVQSHTAELRQREHELSESRAQLQRALDGSQLGTWEWELATDRVQFSALACGILGYGTNEIEPHRQAWAKLVHPDDLARGVAASRAHFLGETPSYEAELRFRTKSGDWHWVRSVGRIVERDAAGQPLRVAGTHADIHARKSAEAALAHRETQLGIALSVSGCSLWDADLKTGRVFVDEQWPVIVGGATGNHHVSLRGLFAGIPAEDRPGVWASFSRLWRGATDDYGFEHRYRHADGSLIWLRSRARCIERTADGRALRVVGTHLDITAAKRSAESLMRQAGLYSAVNRLAVDLLSKRATAEILQALVDRAAGLFDATLAEVSLIKNDLLHVRAHCGPMPSGGDKPSGREAVLAWRAIDSKTPVAVDNYSRVASGRASYRDAGIQAAVVFPIIDGDRAIGVLGLCRTRPDHPFNLDDLQKGLLLAQLAALVLHNASIYEDAVRDAETKTFALRESEWQLREAQRIAHLGHWEYSFVSGARIERWSDETFRIFGHEPQSFAIDRARFDSLVHPDDLAAVRRIVDAAFAARRKFQMDYRIVRPDGTVRWIHDEGEPKCDPAGAVVAMQGIIQDVTDRVAAEAALRASETLYRNLVETIDHGYYVADFRSLFSYVSPAMEAMGGFAPGELLGKSSFRLIAEEDRKRVMAEYQVWRDDPATANVRTEFRVVAKNGRKFWIEQSTHFERDAQGRVTEGRNVIRDISERRTAEAALRESETKFRDLFDHSPVSVVLTSLPEGRIIDFNPTAVRLVGYSKEEVLGRTSTDINLWAHESHRLAFLSDMAERGHVSDLETEFRCRDGTLIHVIVNSRLAVIGGVRCALSTLTDVSEFRRTQHALRDSESRFHGVFDKSPIPLVLAELPDSRIVEANPAAEEYFGFTRHEAIGRSTLELNVWESPEMREVCLAELRRTGSIANYESRLRLKDGRVTSVLIYASIIRLGERQMLLTSLLDITARKNVEAALRESQERFHAVFEESPIMILLLSYPDGRIVEVNAAALRGFGGTREMSLGKTSLDLVAWVDLADRNRYLSLLKTQRNVTGFETRMRRMNGEIFPALFSGSIIEVAGQHYSLNSIQDITVQRQAEERLRQTQKMESLGTLAGGIAHDFNNLLTGILGFVELARGDLPPEHRTRQWLENIAQAGSRAKNLVQQILTFSRQSEAERTAIDPTPLVTEALRLARSALPPMVQLETDFEDALPAIVVNPTQIHQVVMNLLTNAWHALPPSGGVIRVGLHRLSVNETNRAEHPELALGEAVKLTVADNGSGMDKTTLERIFDPFFTTKAPGQGTGLGLAVVHGIVRSHSGAIAVRSQPGQGTTFDIILPAVARAPIVVGDALPLERGQGQSILLVDDDDMVRAPLALLLKRLGYSVDSIGRPDLALARFAAQPESYDLVITDFAMPVLTGAELTRRLRAVRPEIPVLLLSGFVDPSQRESLDDCDATLVLRKPVDLPELSAAVTKCLESRAPAN